MPEIRFDRVGKTYPGGAKPLTDLNLTIAQGEFLVLVGASGCGKSTALRMLAGLEDITEGTISIAGRTVNHLPPQARNIAMVFQNYALYPHMTVRANLEFPLQMRRLPATEVKAKVDHIADMLELGDLLDRRPKQLSGGQRQRVAMGRALVREPDAFLMDEPLSNLDAKLRVQMRSEILTLQRRTKTTTIYVTHDQVEAMTMGTRVAVMRGGRLQQVAPPEDLYHGPANLYVAAFIGSPSMNLFRAPVIAEDGGLHLGIGETRVRIDPRAIERLPALAGRAGQPTVVGLRPEAIVPPQSVPADQRLVIDTIEIEALGHERMVHARIAADPVDADASSLAGAARWSPGPAPLVARLPGDFPAERDSRIEVGLDTSRLFAFDDAGTAFTTR
jgi:multiple sugar transport system ATP-binding protein